MSIADYWSRAVEIFDLAGGVRSWFPLQWRAWLSPWLIWAGIFVIFALLCVLLHFVLRTKPKIEWQFETTGVAVTLGGQWVNKDQLTLNVPGVYFQGENISGHDLHQIDGEIILEHPRGKTFPLYVNHVTREFGRWEPTSQIKSLPPRAYVMLGMDFRPSRDENDLAQINQPPRMSWEGFEKPLSPGDFLHDFGAFKLVITVDGEERSWFFSLDDLRESFDAQEHDAKEQRLRDPSNRPTIEIRGP